MNHHKLVEQWKLNNGDKTLRLNYNLNENSIVIDGGGYKGEWASDIFEKYKCTIHIFEPVKKFYDIIKEKFNGNDKVYVHNYGLSNMDRSVDISIENDASSIYTNNGTKETIKLVDINQTLKKLNLSKVDLMKLNVEGEEYNILEGLIEGNNLSIFNNLQIQFHRYGKDYDNRKVLIETVIRESFIPTYEYNYVWVNYMKK